VITSQSSNSAPPSAAQNQYAVVLGCVEIEVTLRSGQREKVKVRQLPIRLLSDWSRLAGDEAGLAELYCDKADKKAGEQLRNLRTQDFGLVQLITKATDREEVQKHTDELAMIRNKIDALIAEASWDDQLTPDSHDEIIRIGNELNRPRFDRWIADRHAAIGHLKDVYRDHLPEHPLLKDETPPEKAPANKQTSETSSPSAVSS
jgi:hypothetical protein